MNYLIANLKKLMREQNLTQDGLARKAGVSQVTIHKLLTGKILNSSKLVYIAMALGSSSEWLQFNVGEPKAEYLVEKNTTTKYLPVINDEQVLRWNKNSIDDIQKEATEWLVTSQTQSSNAFWMSVIGDAMTSKAGLSIPDGYKVLVDANKKDAKNGDLVIVRLNDDHIVFKQLIVDVESKYIKSLNDAYTMIKLDEGHTIIGTVLESRLILT